MYQLTLANYVLILLALAAHYPIGKRLGIKPFFSATITGVCLSALVVASLANVSAGLIHPYILLTILLGYGLLVYDFVHLRKKSVDINVRHNFTKIYLLLAAAGILILLLNNPGKIFLSTEGNDTYLHFNRHYSYYASQSIEMLDASYFSRLRVPNLYPLEWNTYHFFNSATQAITQGLIGQPSLFSFFIAQIIIIVFILSAFAENLLLAYGWTKKNLLALTLWFIMGFTLFSFSLKWSLITTSPLAVFAAVLIVIAVLTKKYRAATLFSFILGASAFRMMPVAVCLIAYFFIMHIVREKEKIKAVISGIKQIKVVEYLGIVLFAIYNYLTLFAVPAITPATTENNIFSDGWSYMIVSYKFIGYIADLVGKPVLINFNLYGFFDKLLYSGMLRSFLLLFIITSSVLVISELIYIGKKKPTYVLYSSIATIVIVIYCYFAPVPVIKLLLISIPYLLLMTVLAFRPSEKFAWADKIMLYGFIAVSFVSVLIMQYTRLNPDIKVPPMYIMYDIVLWAIIGAYLFITAVDTKRFYVNIALTTLMLILFKFDIVGMIRMSDGDDNYIKAPVTELAASDFKRSNYVDENNTLKIILDNPDMTDVYSSVLGANVPYSKNNAIFMNYRFTNITPTNQ